MEGQATLKRKHDQIQDVSKRKGAFQEGAYPEHYYPIGDNFFVLASVYNNKVGIHIRRFNRYGDSYYPSVTGLTLQPEQFTVSFNHGPPTSIFDIVEINLQLEALNPDSKREFYLLMADDGKYTLTNEHTCRSGRVYKFPLDISFAQWREIQKVKDDVISSFIALKYQCRDFKEIFKMTCKRTLPLEKSTNNPRYHEAEGDLNHCLTLALYKNIGEKKDIRPPMRISDEDIEVGDLVSVKDFNESCMYLSVVSLARDFEKELCENMLYPERTPLIEFLSEQYLCDIQLDILIAAARRDFCSYEF